MSVLMSRGYDYKINTDESKMLIFGRRANHHSAVTVETIVLERAHANLSIFEVLQRKTVDCSAEINRRIHVASERMGTLNKLWSRSEITVKTKISMLVSRVFSRLVRHGLHK